MVMKQRKSKQEGDVLFHPKALTPLKKTQVHTTLHILISRSDHTLQHLGKIYLSEQRKASCIFLAPLPCSFATSSSDPRKGEEFGYSSYLHSSPLHSGKISLSLPCSLSLSPCLSHSFLTGSKAYPQTKFSTLHTYGADFPYMLVADLVALNLRSLGSGGI